MIVNFIESLVDSNLFCESSVVLHEVVGSTQCDKAIAPDIPVFSCSVSYSRNAAPQLEWRMYERESESMTTECDFTGNRVMCNTTLEANLIRDGSVYVCEITTAKQYTCFLTVNKTICKFTLFLHNSYGFHCEF